MLAEAEFERFGLRVRLLPEKLRKDFGLDYLCQVLEPDGRAGHASVTGDVIGAAVRGTSDPKAKVRLRRSDVRHLLTAEFPVCLVLVHLPPGASPQLYFRFMDEPFSAVLAEALKSGTASFTIDPAELLEQAAFPAELERVIKPGFVERVRLSRASRAVEAVLPRSRLVFQRTERGDLTVVEVSDFFAQFAVESPEEKHLVHVAAFGAAGRFAGRFSNLRVKPALIDALKGLPSPIVISSPVLEEVDNGQRAVRADHVPLRAAAYKRSLRLGPRERVLHNDVGCDAARRSMGAHHQRPARSGVRTRITGVPGLMAVS